MLRLVLVLAAVAGALFVPPARAAPPIEAYGKLPGVEDVAMSPSGASYAFIALVGETRKLLVISSAGEVLAVAEFGKAKVRRIWWAGEDHVLAEVSATVTLGVEFTIWRDELFGVGSLNIRTHKVTSIFAKYRDISHSVWGAFGEASVDGRWYGYFGGITFEKGVDPNDVHLRSGVQYPDLYRVDLDTGEARLVTHGSEISAGWLVGPDGAVIARQTYDGRNQHWEVRAGAIGGRVLAAGHSAFGGAELERGRTPDAVLVYAPGDAAQKDGWEEVSLATGQAQAVPDSDSIAEPLHDPETGLWIGVMKEGDEHPVSFFDPMMNARAAATRKAFPDQSVGFEGWNHDLSRLIVFTSGPGDSGTYWTVEIAKGSADPFGYAYPAVRGPDVGPIQMVAWKAADGMELHGVLSLPPGRPAKAAPVVVLPHGGPEARDYPTFDWWAQAFASQGYAVFQPNFRGSAGYGLKLRDAGFGEFGRKMQSDVSDGLAELAREGIVDPKRACIVGGSYGGYVALAGVTLQQGIYRCSVSWGGISDLASFAGYIHDTEGDEPGPGARYWRAFVGDHASEVSPIRFASHADAPILLLHGKDDTVVPLDQSQRMLGALKAAGKPVELIVMPSEDHWLSREETREAMLKAAVAFVEKYNPPDTPAHGPAH